ncbi:MAG: hypothetical protein ACE5D6_00595 [Candidatus Zixiibacteriota bacterium]
MVNDFSKGNKFTIEEAEKIGNLLGAEKVLEEKDRFRLKIINFEEKRTLSLEIFPETVLGKTRGMLIVVYTGNSHLQLHNVNGYIISEELKEITFVSESDNRLSGLVVEHGASCSLYAGINREIISSDFTRLGVEVMLSGVALSLAEEVLTKNKRK